MTLRDEKRKVLSLIEEISPESEYLTEDPDIQLKINSVFNQISNELSRVKKIPTKMVYNTTISKTLKLSDIPMLYQINNLSTSKYRIVGNFEIIFDEDVEEEVTIYYYKYPKLIPIEITPEEGESEQAASERIDNSYVFELSEDVLEIMPYGVAADLLKNDMISNYGKYYDERYRTMIQMIDSRVSSGPIVAEGGLDI